jgi:hypothetical protein
MLVPRPMKKMICFLVLGTFSCEMEKKPDERSALYQAESNGWIVYEGCVPLNEESNLLIELSVLPTDRVGEGFFQMKEFIEKNYQYTPTSAFKGKYSTLYGEGEDDIIVQFHNSAQAEGVKRTYLTPGFEGNLTDTHIQMIREERFRQTDLAVKIQGKNKLLVLDQNQQPISIERQFNLAKRTSKLFTLEGYFRHNGDTADFLEMNTKEKWAVSKRGEYGHAINQYHQLAKDKFEVTYLKAIGYSIQHTNKEGKEVDALVLKKVLQMTSSPTLTHEYNLLVH